MDAASLLSSCHPGEFGRRLRKKITTDASRIYQLFGHEDDSTLVFQFYEGGFYEFNLMCRLYSTFPRARFAFNFNLTDPWHRIMLSTRNPISRVLRNHIRSATTKMSKRVFFTTESEPLRRLFRETIGLETELYPVYSTVSPRHPVEKKVDLLSLVGSDEEAMLVAKTLQELRIPQSKLNTVVSTRWGYRLPQKLEEEFKARGTKLATGLLTASEYTQLLDQTKLALLPYFDDYYKWSSSARLLDAVNSDCHVIVPKKSTLGSLVEENKWGFCVDSKDPQRIAEIVQTFVWKKLTSMAPSPEDAAKYLIESVDTTRTDLEASSRRPSQMLLLYLNLGLNPRLFIGRYIDSNNFLANLSLRVRAFLASLTARASTTK